MNTARDFKEGIEKGYKAFSYPLQTSENNDDYMDHAIKMAELSSSGDKENETFLGSKIPQPKIGAVLVTANTVHCACRSALKNGDHAEFTVMETLSPDEDLSNAVLYTTLEPCTPESRNKTESCSEIAINRRVEKVYIGTLDGNPLVFGRGVKYLMNNDIQVDFFNKKFNEDLRKINDEFFKFYEDFPDIKTLKKVDNYLHAHLNLKAIKIYLSEGKIINEEAKDSELVDFYRIMLKKNQIMEGKFPGQVICTKDFALAFMKKPSEFVPGCNVGIIDKTKNSERRKLVDKSYIELLNAESDESIYNEIKQHTSSHFSASGNFSLLREVLANALIHTDYSKNIGPTIIFDSTYVTIINCSSKQLDNKSIEKYSYSIPFNSTLMEFMIKIGFVESTRLGFDEIEKHIKNSEAITISNNNDVIEVKIPLSLFVSEDEEQKKPKKPRKPKKHPSSDA